MDILAVREAYRVRRFHTVRVINEETLGHHSANVAMLCLWLDPMVHPKVVEAALKHDVHELYTGDLPAPFKWAHEAIASSIEDTEMAFEESIRLQMPELDEIDQESVSDLDILKAADMLDLVLRAIEEWGMGNQYAKRMLTNGEVYLREMGLPTAMWEKIEHLVQEAKSEWSK